jgi:hypothetical protein
MTSADAKHALLPIMSGQYQRIEALEAPWGIRLHEGDQRPRIEHFHDAVRALTGGTASLYEKNSRLSIEHLAYDISQLRIAQQEPLGRINALHGASVSDALAVANPPSVQQRQRGPDRAQRAELAQLYKDYTVLFAALFAEIADINYQSRIEEVDQAVEELAMVEKIVTQLADGKCTQQQAMAMLEQISNDSLREKAQQAISRTSIRHREAEVIIAGLRGMLSQCDMEKRVIESSHLNYVTARLAVYEASKDTVKRLAAQGLNLAGKYVEAALTQTAGRGAGMGV